MNKDDIRLNKSKRDAIKLAWRDVVLKQTPTAKDEDLRNACDNFRNLEKSTWDSVIKPTVERFYPQSDMKILKKYSRNSNSGTFAEWDNCFYFKPTFEDRSEVQFRWSYSGEDMTALYYDDIMNLGGNPNLEIEHENREPSPKFYEQREKLQNILKDSLKVPRYEGYSNDRYSFHNIEDWKVNRMDGFAMLVPSTGGCHSRVMMIDSESDWQLLRTYNKSRSAMINAQRDVFKEKNMLINDMNMVIDQSKFLSEVKPYWEDIELCVNFDDQNIGTAISIVSEETKDRLKESAKLRQAHREMLAVVKTPAKELVS